MVIMQLFNQKKDAWNVYEMFNYRGTHVLAFLQKLPKCQYTVLFKYYCITDLYMYIRPLQV